MRLLLALLGLGLAAHACTMRPSPATPKAAPPAVVDVPRSASLVTNDDGGATCAALAVEQGNMIAGAFAVQQELEPSFRETARRTLEGLARICVEDERGIWMTRIDELTTNDPKDAMEPLSLHLSLVRIRRDGRRTVLRHPLLADDGEPLRISDMMFLEGDPPVVFDFDGDGRSEIFLRVRGHHHESRSWTQGRIFTFKDSPATIIEYEPAKGIPVEQLEDVDGDGRPDLLGFGPFDTTLEGCCSGFDHRVTGPLLVAHAKADGTFAHDDDVTRRSASKACADHQGPIIEKNAPWKEENIALRIACARLRGVSGEAITRELALAPGGKMGVCDLETCTDHDETRASLGHWADPKVTKLLR